jgi:tetratricopeptide (TPR) repeat protein
MTQQLQKNTELETLIKEMREAVSYKPLRAVEIMERLLPEVNEDTPKDLQFHFYKCCANVCINRHEHDQAEMYFRKLFGLQASTGNLEWEVMAKLSYGVFLTAKSELNAAIKIFDEIIDKAKNLREEARMIANIKMRKGIALGKAGKLQESLECYLEALSFFSYTNDETRFSVQANLLTNYMQLNMEKELNELYETMSKEIDQCKNESVLVYFYSNYGVYLNDKGEHEKALASAEKALTLCSDPRQWSPKAIAQRVKASSLYHLGKLKLSYLYHLRCENTLSHTNDFYSIALILLSKANLLFDCGKHEKAVTIAKKGYETAKNNHILYIQKMALELLIKMCIQLNNNTSAITYLFELNEVKDQIFNSERIKAVSELQTKYDVAIKEAETQKLKKDIAEYNLRLLRSQMNPHFIFNSINSINNFVLRNQAILASEYLMKFAQLMRHILDASNQNEIPLEKEIAFLNNYLQLEQLRMENPFTYSIEVDENIDVLELKIPPLLLQPFVENSIWHGSSHKKETVHIHIIFKEQNNELVAEVIDNGIGREKSRALNQKSKVYASKGISITRERIEKGLNGTIEIIDLKNEDNHPTGTHTKIKIPLS